MVFLNNILFLLLGISLWATLVKKGKYALPAKLLRWGSVIAGFTFFTVWFVKSSLYETKENAIGLQIINKLPSALDFYVIEVESHSGQTVYQTIHLGNIRPEHFRIEYLKMDNSSEYWILGKMGTKNNVYLSQHFVPNKNIDQIVEADSYEVNNKIADTADRQIEAHFNSLLSVAVMICLNFLLLFFNVALLIKK